MDIHEVTGFAAIEDAFDALIIDQFGVLHDGVRPYAGVADALLRLHERGKRMIVLSNSGRRAQANADRLAELGLPMRALEAVITSGEVAWRALAERADPFHRGLGRRCVLVTEPAEADFLDGLDFDVVADAAQADFVLVVTVGAEADVVARRESLLVAAARRGLPLLCANNDIVRPAGGDRLAPAPGAVARRYSELGGQSHYYGKPLGAFFEHCLQRLEGVPRERVLMVGDSIEHDIAGAGGARIGSVYIRDGIGGAMPDAELRSRLAATGVPRSYVMARFAWDRASA